MERPRQQRAGLHVFTSQTSFLKHTSNSSSPLCNGRQRPSQRSPFSRGRSPSWSGPSQGLGMSPRPPGSHLNDPPQDSVVSAPLLTAGITGQLPCTTDLLQHHGRACHHLLFLMSHRRLGRGHDLDVRCCLDLRPLPEDRKIKSPGSC